MLKTLQTPPFGLLLLFACVGELSGCLISDPTPNAGDAGGFDAGSATERDAGAATAGDAGAAGSDAGAPSEGDVDAGGWTDSGSDAGLPADAGQDAGHDAGPGPANDCDGTLVCDDFESQPLGEKPGAPWSTSLSNTQVSIVVDGARAHSGSRAVKVAAGASSGYQSAMLNYQGSKLPTSGNDLYGRMMFWLESAPSSSVHWTFIDGYGLLPGKTYHAYYRYGGQHPISENGQFVGNQLMANYETPDIYQNPPVGIGSDCWLHSDKKLVPVGRWACAEWHFDGSANKMQFWLDGTELSDLALSGTGQGCTQQSASFPWTAPTFERIDVGWESYQADEARTLWIDDLAIATQRIGCPRP
jgi:hypothetical protein